jgi:hypothetical protein
MRFGRCRRRGLRCLLGLHRWEVIGTLFLVCARECRRCGRREVVRECGDGDRVWRAVR